jgi:hypothetical protein
VAATGDGSRRRPVILLAITGCVGGASDSEQGEYRLVPSSTNRPTDPPLPTDYDKNGGGLSAEEASLSQLWATANSEVGDAASTPGAGLADFSAAITSRCYSLLSEAEAAEFEQLKAGYESLSGAEAAGPAHAYFVRATELCM